MTQPVQNLTNLGPSLSHSSSRVTLGAVVVTHNRCQRLQRWLDCIAQQSLAPDEILVIDNGSTDGTSAMLAERYPSVCVFRSEVNTGSAGGGQLALEQAVARGFDWFFAFDDDAFPQPEAMEKTYALAQARLAAGEKIGMVWMPFSDLGGWMWNGTKRPVSLREASAGGKQAFQVDQIDLNMTLLSRPLVEKIGVPRGDFFMMMWANEYCLRAQAAGYTIVVMPEVLCVHEHAGSTTGGEWRTYYQTRNHLRMVLERRLWRELFWCLGRQARFLAATLLRGPTRVRRLTYRLRGMWDGLRGKTGLVIRPPGK